MTVALNSNTLTTICLQNKHKNRLNKKKYNKKTEDFLLIIKTIIFQ